MLGAWRTRYRGLGNGDPVSGTDRTGHDFRYVLSHPVDARGTLSGGERFQDIHELKNLLARQPRKLATNLLRQFTLYATGTPMRFSDRIEIAKILDVCHDQGYRVRDLLYAFIERPHFPWLPRKVATGNQTARHEKTTWLPGHLSRHPRLRPSPGPASCRGGRSCVAQASRSRYQRWNA